MWFKWVCIAILVLDIVGTIRETDKPRPPVTSVTALANTAVELALIVGLLYYWRACR